MPSAVGSREAVAMDRCGVRAVQPRLNSAQEESRSVAPHE
jgi:hypothetical protein